MLTNYTHQDYERDIKILEGAPEDGSAEFVFIVDGVNWYAKLFEGRIKEWYPNHNSWLSTQGFLDVDAIRYLSDIRSLVSMYEKLKEAKVVLEEAAGWNWLV